MLVITLWLIALSKEQSVLGSNKATLSHTRPTPTPIYIASKYLSQQKEVNVSNNNVNVDWEKPKSYISYHRNVFSII